MSQPVTVPPVPTGPPARPARRFGSAADMVRSLAVVFAIIAVILVFTPREDADLTRPFDWQQAFLQAQVSADFPVLAPLDLPTTWKANNARSIAGPPGGTVAWHVGFVTPQEQYAAVEQADGDTGEFVADMTRRGSPDGTVEVAGETYERRFRRVGDQDYRSLLRQAEGSTLLVVGTASYEELGQLAAALRPGPG